MSKRFLRPAIAFLVGCMLVVLCYYFVDRPVAWYVYNHRTFSHEMLQSSPLISDCVTYSITLIIVGIVIWRFWRPGGPSQKLIFVLALNLVATTVVKTFLKWVFGRNWPEAWGHDVHSLIATGDYGFHPFHYGGAYQSFPSGHTAATFAVLSILWISRPRWRWLYALLASLACVALVFMNFHFVGDVIAGAMLGTITGDLAARWFDLRPDATEALSSKSESNIP